VFNSIVNYFCKIFIFTFLFTFSSFIFLIASNYDDPPWVYKGRGDRYYKKGEIGKAIVEYKKALSASTRSYEIGIYPEVNIRLAEIYLSESLFDLSLLHVNRAIEHKSHFQIPDFIYDVLYLKAEIFLKQEKFNEAISTYGEIIKDDFNWKNYARQNPYEISPIYINEPELHKKFGKAYLEIGKIKYHNKNYDNAIPFFKMAIMYKYEKDTALKYLINCYNFLGNNVLAEKAKRVYGNS